MTDEYKKLERDIIEYLETLQALNQLFYTKISQSQEGCPRFIICYSGGIFIALHLKVPNSSKYLPPRKLDASILIEEVGGLFWMISSPAELKKKFKKLDKIIEKELCKK